MRKAERGGGSIVNMSSVAGLMGVAGHMLYGASKGAVRIMMKDAAMELGDSQVKINSVHPGYINTGMAAYRAAAAGTDIEGLGQLYPPPAHRGARRRGQHGAVPGFRRGQISHGRGVRR